MDLSSFLSLNPKRPKPICNNSNEGKEPVPSAPVNHQEDLSDEDYGTPIPATSDSVVGYSASILVGYLGEAYFQMIFFSPCLCFLIFSCHITLHTWIWMESALNIRFQHFIYILYYTYIYTQCMGWKMIEIEFLNILLYSTYMYLYMYRMFFQRDLVLYGQKRLAQEPSDF